MDALDPVLTLVDEAKLHISENGIHIKAVDPANVGMVEMELDSDEFEELETDDLVLGVNLTRFMSQIQDIDDEPVGDEEQTLHIELDEKTRKVAVWGTPGSMEFTMSLIDPESIRQEPDIPDMELPGYAEIMSSYFNHAMKTADKYSEHITFGMDGENGSFFMTADGDTDDFNATLDSDHHSLQALDPASVSSIYSLDYFDDIRKGVPDDISVEMELGEEFPTRLHFEYLGGNASVAYTIAPRIEED